MFYLDKAKRDSEAVDRQVLYMLCLRMSLKRDVKNGFLASSNTGLKRKLVSGWREVCHLSTGHSAHSG